MPSIAPSQADVLRVWANGDKCFAAHAAKAVYIVTGDNTSLPSCGDHLTRAVTQLCTTANPPLIYVTVWRKP